MQTKQGEFTKDQEDFLWALFDGCDGLVEFRALPSRSQLITQDNELLTQFIQEHDNENLFVGIATRNDSSNGKLNNCQYLGALFIDLDFKQVSEEKALNKIEQCPLGPSMVVLSGGGYHAYWFLKKPLNLQNSNDRTLSQQSLRRLARYFDADLNVAEPARVLRLPDTWNFKYDPRRRVELAYLDSDKLYELENFENWLPEKSSKKFELDLPKTIPEGKRNQTLYQYGRRLHAQGRSPAEIEKELRWINGKQCNPPLQDREVDQLVQKVTTQPDRPDFTKDDPSLYVSEFKPVPMEIFLGGKVQPTITYIWENLLPIGSIGILTSEPKCGKSTFLSYLISALSTGTPFLGRSMHQGNVLLLACEESDELIKNRFSRLSFDGERIFIKCGFLNPNQTFYNQLEQFILEHEISLVIIDTLGNFWNVEDENNATKVTKAIKPLLLVARTTKACLLLVHHNRKSGGTSGADIRGSNALLGGVDFSFSLKKAGPGNRRTLSIISRYPNTSPKLLMALNGGEYVDLGDLPVASQTKEDKILSFLTEELMTIQDMANAVGLPYNTVSKALKKLCKEGRIHMKPGSGRGGRKMYGKSFQEDLNGSDTLLD